MMFSSFLPPQSLPLDMSRSSYRSKLLEKTMGGPPDQYEYMIYIIYMATYIFTYVYSIIKLSYLLPFWALVR